MLFLLTNIGKVWVFLRISLGKVFRMEWQACHSIPLSLPEEIPQKTHTFPPLVNKNIKD